MQLVSKVPLQLVLVSARFKLVKEGHGRLNAIGRRRSAELVLGTIEVGLPSLWLPSVDKGGYRESTDENDRSHDPGAREKNCRQAQQGEHAHGPLVSAPAHPPRPTIGREALRHALLQQPLSFRPLSPSAALPVALLPEETTNTHPSRGFAAAPRATVTQSSLASSNDNAPPCLP